MKLPFAALALSLLGLAPALAQVDDVTTRRMTSTVVEWRTSDPNGDGLIVHLIGINDLHGHLAARDRLPDVIDSRRVGGAAQLASWIKAVRLQAPGRTLLLFAGDSFGASPAESGLLHDEPTLEVMNLLADGDCPPDKREWAGKPFVETSCHVIATPGNHEFDRGTAEFERLLYGGNSPQGKVLDRDWKGSHIPFVAANVVLKDGGSPLLPSAALVNLSGLRIGVVGAVTADTPALVSRDRIKDLEFLPEAAPINAAVARLRAAGAMAIVLVIHEGLTAPTTPQPVAVAPSDTTGRLAAIIAALDPGVDVVVSGHTHKFSNLLMRGKDPDHPLLVTQARDYGTAFSDIELVVDPVHRKVVQKMAEVLTNWDDEGPGRSPDDKIAKLIAKAELATRPVTGRLIGAVADPITRRQNESGESALGLLVADAMRSAAHADMAFVLAGGLRADLPAGAVSFGTLYSVLPFGNALLRVNLTGEQIERLLQSQWTGEHAAVPSILQVSGLTYLCNWSLPANRRLVAAYDATGARLDAQRRYSVAVNDFLADGGAYFSVFNEATDRAPVSGELEALEAYVRAQPGALTPPAGARATRIGGSAAGGAPGTP